jgi:hypothetical protein
MVVAGESTGEQVRLAEDLEAIADAKHRQSLLRARDDGRHHRSELRDGAAAKIVAVGETTGEYDGVNALQIVVTVPEGDRLCTGESHRALGVAVVKRSREGDDANLHR